MKNPVLKIGVAVTVCALLLLCIVICGVYINYMEYLEIGANFSSVFWVNFNAEMLTFLTSFLVFWALLFSNFFVLKNNLLTIDHFFNNINFIKKNIGILFLSLLLALVFSFFSCSE